MAIKKDNKMVQAPHNRILKYKENILEKFK
jgi:hypothetical protein